MNSITELSLEELEQVGGAGLFSLLGNAITSTVAITNAVLNTPLVSSVGQTFNKFGPLGTAVHFAADTAGYALFKTAATVGQALGGSTSGINYHYGNEWGLGR